MPSTHAPVLEVEDEDIREVSPASVVLWRRLGIEALPEHETMLLPTERLVVPDAAHLVRSAKRLVKSIQHVGILQNPSVVVKAGESADGLVPGLFAALPITGFALIRYHDGSVNDRAKEKILVGLEAHESHALPFYETDR